MELPVHTRRSDEDIARAALDRIAWEGSLPADAAAETACATLARGLKGLSRERVGWELVRLLALADPAPTVTRMAQLGVLAQILPEGDPARLPALIAAEQRADVAPDALRRLGALLPADPPLAEAVAARLRLSAAQKKRLSQMAARHPDDAHDPRGLAYRLGLTEARDRLLLSGADCALLRDWTPPAFPLKGGAIVGRGVHAGPDVARILRAVEAAWIAEGFPDAARVAALLDAQLLSDIGQAPLE